MSFPRAVLAAFALALLAGAPALAMPASPMPKMQAKSPHMCRDAKGHFIKGKYMRCPNGTHAV